MPRSLEAVMAVTTRWMYWAMLCVETIIIAHLSAESRPTIPVEGCPSHERQALVNIPPTVAMMLIRQYWSVCSSACRCWSGDDVDIADSCTHTSLPQPPDISVDRVGSHASTARQPRSGACRHRLDAVTKVRQGSRQLLLRLSPEPCGLLARRQQLLVAGLEALE